jgi:hypothetical protein
MITTMIIITATIMTTTMTTIMITRVRGEAPDQEGSGLLAAALRPVARPAPDLPFRMGRSPLGKIERGLIHADIERAMRLKVEGLVMAARAVQQRANRNYQRNHCHLGIE